jgi:hypothetical protein
MSFEMFLIRCRRFWWIPLLLTILFTFLGFSSFVDKVEYRANISVGATYNNPEYLKTLPQDRALSLSKLGEYLSNRFKSPEIQVRIAQETQDANSSNKQKSNEISEVTIDYKKPFYDVANQENGFVSIGANFRNEVDAQSFLAAIKSTYKNLIETENYSELPAYRIRPMDNFKESIIKIKTPIQFKVLPTILGLLLGLLLLLVLPFRAKRLTHDINNIETNEVDEIKEI